MMNTGVLHSANTARHTTRASFIDGLTVADLPWVEVIYSRANSAVS
jgi:hypothetical protein